MYTNKKLLWATIVVYSRDNEWVGMAHKITSPKNQLQFSQMVIPNKPSGPLKSYYGIKKLTEFSTDWLTN